MWNNAYTIVSAYVILLSHRKFACEMRFLYMLGEATHESEGAPIKRVLDSGRNDVLQCSLGMPGPLPDVEQRIHLDIGVGDPTVPS